jgi:hypothetical protein
MKLEIPFPNGIGLLAALDEKASGARKESFQVSGAVVCTVA